MAKAEYLKGPGGFSEKKGPVKKMIPVVEMIEVADTGPVVAYPKPKANDGLSGVMEERGNIKSFMGQY